MIYDKERQATKIYITKFALTKGIFTRDAEIDESNTAWIVGSTHTELYFKKDYFLTFEEAKQDAIARQQKKIVSLKKQLVKLESKEFKE